jgi:hypothetical protein
MMLRGVDPSCATTKPSSEATSAAKMGGEAMGAMGVMGGGPMAAAAGA